MSKPIRASLIVICCLAASLAIAAGVSLRQMIHDPDTIPQVRRPTGRRIPGIATMTPTMTPTQTPTVTPTLTPTATHTPTPDLDPCSDCPDPHGVLEHRQRADRLHEAFCRRPDSRHADLAAGGCLQTQVSGGRGNVIHSPTGTPGRSCWCSYCQAIAGSLLGDSHGGASINPRTPAV